MKTKVLYILFFIGIISQSIIAQVKFTADVSKNKLGVNEHFRIIFSINKQGADNFKPPEFKYFKVVGGPSQSVNQSWINGKVSFSQSYIYVLQPKRIGTYTIANAQIQFNNKTLKSNNIKINVLKAVDLPKNPNDPNYIAQQSVHLVAEVSKTKPYVGEEIYVEHKLYFGHNVGISNYTVSEYPQYNGFWNQNIKIKQLKIEDGKYNNKKYRYIVLRKALLIPTKSGKLIIDPIKIAISVSVPTGKGDFFGNSVNRSINIVFASPRRTILAKKLPLRNKPKNFNGAVGEFNFTVTSSKNELKANESSQIKVAVTGKGNLKLFEIPKIETPKELEVYTPEHTEKVGNTLKGLKGLISDLYTVVPQYKGKFKIPKVSFSYFNPIEEKYKTITTEDIFVTVLEGKEIAVSMNNNQKKDIVITGANFRYIQTKSEFTSIEKDDFFQSNIFYVLLFLPLVTIPVGMFISNRNVERNKDIIGAKQRKADRLVRKYLSEAKKQLGKKEGFYIALEKALHNYLKAKLQLETSDISRDKIKEILLKRNVTKQATNSFINVLNDCDFARYTPITDVMINDEFKKATRAITQLDKQL